MPEPNLRFEQLIAKLKGRDYRVTPQRMALIHTIVTCHEHPNAAQIYEQIRNQFPTTSLATVYKTLDLLKEMGEVLEIGLRTEIHYDGIRPYPHPHLICLSCHKISDGELEASIQTLLNKMEHVCDFQILLHQLNFYGLCSDCQKNSH